jgi:hypothetical protein
MFCSRDPIEDILDFDLTIHLPLVPVDQDMVEAWYVIHDPQAGDVREIRLNTCRSVFLVLIS